MRSGSTGGACMVLARCILAGLISSAALAQAGMWAVSIHFCTIAGKCSEGVMTKNNSPLYVSKLECERGAQRLVNEMQSLGMVVKYAKCVQL